ncbi:hypothetical protein [Pelosinus sp. sgz500959]|uniref:hypothetical protein n=1 Tax=Pelosinus sp. sgz500959 TaxID=3242472 RepID=UPI003671DC3A
MKELEEKIYKIVYQNSILFLRESISHITKTENNELDKPIDRETAVLACVFIQLSLELAIKAIIIKLAGLKCILDSKHQNLDKDSLAAKLGNNQLSILKYESLKNFMKSKPDCY